MFFPLKLKKLITHWPYISYQKINQRKTVRDDILSWKHCTNLLPMYLPNAWFVPGTWDMSVKEKKNKKDKCLGDMVLQFSFNE